MSNSKKPPLPPKPQIPQKGFQPLNPGCGWQGGSGKPATGQGAPSNPPKGGSSGKK